MINNVRKNSSSSVVLVSLTIVLFFSFFSLRAVHAVTLSVDYNNNTELSDYSIKTQELIKLEGYYYFVAGAFDKDWNYYVDLIRFDSQSNRLTVIRRFTKADGKFATYSPAGLNTISLLIFNESLYLFPGNAQHTQKVFMFHDDTFTTQTFNSSSNRKIPVVDPDNIIQKKQSEENKSCRKIREANRLTQVIEFDGLLYFFYITLTNVRIMVRYVMNITISCIGLTV